MSNNAAALRAIADGTIETVRRGYIEDRLNRTTTDITNYLRTMMKGTKYYHPDHQHLANWRNLFHQYPNQPPVHVEIQLMTTLQGCQYMQSLPGRNLEVGVLNFASATRPGGGFRNGASAQEESLARSSTLFEALESTTAKPFYDFHKAPERDHFYSHAMIYSPQVLLFRDDKGGWLTPSIVDVLTCAAVNAKQVRKHPFHRDDPHIETWIAQSMRERMARLLALFECRGARNLVLGSFGTGVFQNDVETVAKIWKELLFDQGARFRFSFNSVLFAISDPRTEEEFRRVFSNSRPSSRQSRHSGHGH